MREGLPLIENDSRKARARCGAVEALLQPGETIVWTGAPTGMLFLSRRQKAALGFSLAWWLALLFIGWSARTFAGSPLLIAVGLFMVIGALQDSWRTGKWLLEQSGEHYALTDRRVLVIDRKGGLKAEASLLSAQAFHAVPATGARGAIVLDEDAPLFAFGQGRPLRINPAEDAPRFSDVPGHVALLELIRTTAAAWETRWAAEQG